MKPHMPALLFHIPMRKACSFVVFMLLMSLQVSGCARIMYPKCRHYAIMNAMVFGEHCPVRIAVGPTPRGKWHAQAEAFLDGEWKPLNAAPSAVGISKQHDFKPKYYLTLNKAMNVWCPKKSKHERSEAGFMPGIAKLEEKQREAIRVVKDDQGPPRTTIAQTQQDLYP